MFLWRRSSWISRKSFPTLIEEDRGSAVAQPVGGDLPHSKRSARRPEPQIERPIGNLRGAGSWLPAESPSRRRSLCLRGILGRRSPLEALPLEERRTQPS